MGDGKVTAPGLTAMKSRGEKISALTAYDYAWGRLIDEAGIDIALVGDSLGRVVLGYDNELSVTMEDMIRHTAAVRRGVERALLAADMPFMSYQVNVEEAVRNAGRLVSEAGAQVVKLEGAGALDAIRRIVEIGIPVFGHVGLTPQSVHSLGGMKLQGKDAANAERIRNEALALQDAGVCAVILEAIPAKLAAEITASLTIPTIGIGAGPDCDGHVLVTHDILNMYDRLKPSYVKQYADVWQITLDAFKAYSDDVKQRRFPERK
jgi:3-methyl-2-oxobutanoate hydroxymethyltransferase